MSWLDLKKPIIALAPMADITDQVFCRVCREVNHLTPNPSPCKGDGKNKKFLPLVGGEFSPFVIFREMLSAEAIVRGNEKTLKMGEIDPMERPVVIQLFGAQPQVIVEAARKILEKGSLARLGGSQDDSGVAMCDGIDINMGCPVPKIAGKGKAGSYLMKDHNTAVEIVKALKKANLGLPISVKTRLGWSKKTDILEFAPKLEQAGADAIEIHGRTKMQGYSGEADWEMIARAVKTVKIPVIANGDIKNAEDIKKCLEITGASGVMIGRAAIGNPWVLSGVSGLSGYPDNPDLQIVKDVALRHAELHQEHYGDLVSFRKHLLCYFKGFEGVKELRQKLVKISNLTELQEILAK